MSHLHTMHMVNTRQEQPDTLAYDAHIMHGKNRQEQPDT